MGNFMMLPYYFIHIASSQSFPTADPHRWLLDHREDDLLAPARERLMLSADDPERCIRAVLRRCGLVLVRVVIDSQIVVQHWNDPAPDIRAWAKAFGWNKSGTGVVFENLKTGKVVVHQDGQDVLLHGESVGLTFPWVAYETKYERRLAEERDDHGTASASATNFERANCPHGTLTWQVLKTVWNADRAECPNCDLPLVLVAFEWRLGMLSFRSARIVRHCLRCRRRFEASEDRPLAWLASVLPAPLRPTHMRLWEVIAIDWLRLLLGHGRPVHIIDRVGA